MGFMTIKRRELLETLANHGTVANAAKIIGISEDAAKSRLYSLRVAYDRNKQDCVEYEKYKLKLERNL